MSKMKRLVTATLLYKFKGLVWDQMYAEAA